MGALGIMLRDTRSLGYLAALLAHEHVHRVNRHGLWRLLASLAAGLAWGFAAALAASSAGPDPLLPTLAGSLAGVTAWSLTALAMARHHERQADAHAAWVQGWAWHRLVSELLYVRPTPLDLLIYGTREQRLARIRDAVKASPSKGYPARVAQEA